MNRLAPRLRHRFNVASLEMHVRVWITPTDMSDPTRRSMNPPARRQWISSVGPTEKSNTHHQHLVFVLVPYSYLFVMKRHHARRSMHAFARYRSVDRQVGRQEDMQTGVNTYI